MTQFIIYKDVAGPNNKLPLCNMITTTMTMFVRLTVALIMEGNLILWELGVTWPAVCCSWNLEVSDVSFFPYLLSYAFNFWPTNSSALFLYL